jgi:hypothetical protein
VSKEGREFATISTSLLALSAWLVEQRCPMGAMESTGVSWTPVDHVLAGTVEVCIGNAPERHSPYCGAGTYWPRWALLCVALGPRRTWPRGLGDVLGIMKGPANGTEAKRARGARKAPTFLLLALGPRYEEAQYDQWKPRQEARERQRAIQALERLGYTVTVARVVSSSGRRLISSGSHPLALADHALGKRPWKSRMRTSWGRIAMRAQL